MSPESTIPANWSPKWYWVLIVLVVFAPSIFERLLEAQGWLPSSHNGDREQPDRIELKVDALGIQNGLVLRQLEYNADHAWTVDMEEDLQRAWLQWIEAQETVSIRQSEIPPVRQIHRTHKPEIRWEKGNAP